MFLFPIEEPDILIQGENEILCGGTARFEAKVKNVESSCWSITWQKHREDVFKRIDTNMERYTGSTKKILVINDVSKKDEGEYQAVLRFESNGPDYKSRNTIRLHAIGGTVVNKTKYYISYIRSKYIKSDLSSTT